MSTEENKALVLRSLEEMDKQNFDVFYKLCTPDFVFHFAGAPQPINREGIRQMATSEYTAFPDYKHTVEDIIAEGDKIAVRMTLSGTHKGEFEGLPPTGKKIEYAGIIFFHVANGKIAEAWAVEDTLGMMQQLGMELGLKQADE